jgi:hypothetical protein
MANNDSVVTIEHIRNLYKGVVQSAWKAIVERLDKNQPQQQQEMDIDYSSSSYHLFQDKNRIDKQSNNDIWKAIYLYGHSIYNNDDFKRTRFYMYTQILRKAFSGIQVYAIHLEKPERERILDVSQPFTITRLLLKTKDKYEIQEKLVLVDGNSEVIEYEYVYKAENANLFQAHDHNSMEDFINQILRREKEILYSTTYFVVA